MKNTFIEKNTFISGAKKDGVSLVHGNSSSFYIEFEEIFKVIFEFWLNFSISEDKLSDSWRILRGKIQQVQEKTAHQRGRQDKSLCSKVPDIGNIMISRLGRVVNEITV